MDTEALYSSRVALLIRFVQFLVFCTKKCKLKKSCKSDNSLVSICMIEFSLINSIMM